MFKVHEYDIVDWCARGCDYLQISGFALIETTVPFPI
jgi:hypothetical protein